MLTFGQVRDAINARSNAGDTALHLAIAGILKYNNMMHISNRTRSYEDEDGRWQVNNCLMLMMAIADDGLPSVVMWMKYDERYSYYKQLTDNTGKTGNLNELVEESTATGVGHLDIECYILSLTLN